PEDQLAITCALEHFTAMMAEQLLGDPRMSDGVDPSHAAIWRWHAAEEAEHKAVAFDVYAKVDGSYIRRIRTYLVTSIMFAGSTLAMTGYLLAKDRKLLEPRHHLALLRWLLVSPGLARNVLPGWFDYLRPSFHPWDRDDGALLDRWAREWAPAFRWGSLGSIRRGDGADEGRSGVLRAHRERLPRHVRGEIAREEDHHVGHLE